MSILGVIELWLLVWLGVVVAQKSETKPPNILLILTDDLGYGEVNVSKARLSRGLQTNIHSLTASKQLLG